MFCSQCKNDIVDCTCDDLEERLNSLSKSPYLAIDFNAIKEANAVNKLVREFNTETGSAGQ